MQLILDISCAAIIVPPASWPIRTLLTSLIANWREANAIDPFSDRPNVYALDDQDRRVLGPESNIVGGQDDVWTVVAIPKDAHEAVVVNIAGGVGLIHPRSDLDVGDAVCATVSHAARSVDRGAGTIGFALPFIGPIRRDKQLIGVGPKRHHCQQ
jgi:hypothetical protein